MFMCQNNDTNYKKVLEIRKNQYSFFNIDITQ